MTGSVNIYYSDVDALLNEFAIPTLRDVRQTATRTFFERRCVEGRNLRIRIEHEDAGVTKAVAAKIAAEAAAFVELNPSAPVSCLSQTSASKLATLERTLRKEDAYLVNRVLVEEYERECPRDGSPELLELLHRFLTRSSDLAALAIEPRAKKFERFLEALYLSTFFFGDTPLHGAVTFYAHWTVLDHWFEPRYLITRIIDSYPCRRDCCHEIFRRVERERLTHANPFLEGMSEALREAIGNAFRDPAKLARSIEYAADEPAIKRSHSLLDENAPGFDFLNTLYGEPRYLANADFNPAVQVTRLVVNLLYHFASQLGLRAVDRFAACYFVQQTISELHGGDYHMLLKGFVQQAQERFTVRVEA